MWMCGRGRRGREFHNRQFETRGIGHTAVENSSCTRPGTAAHRIAAAARDARQDEKAGNAENAEGIKEGNAGSGRKAKAAAARARADAANLAGRGEQGADALTGINAYGYAGVGIKVSIK